MGVRFYAAFVLVAALAGCAGAGDVLPRSVPDGSFGTHGTERAMRVPVSLRLVIGHRHRHRGGRSQRYVSPSTNGAAVAVYVHGAPHTASNLVTSVVVNLSPGSAACGGHKTFPRTCTATLVLPPSRAYDAVIDTYNTPPSPSGSFAGASLLAIGTLTDAQVRVGKSNDWTVYCSGVIYGLSGLPPSVSLPGDGAPHSIAIAIDPEDFGNKPISAGSKDPFANPIAVTIQETNDTGHASLSLNGGPEASKVVVGKSSDSVQLRYDGGGAAFYGITVTLTAGTAGGFGGATEAMNVRPLILLATGCCHYQVPPYLTMGGNGDVMDVYETELNAPSGTTYTATTSHCSAIADVTTIKGMVFGIPGFTVFARPVQSDNGCTIDVSDGTSVVTVQVLNDYNGFLGTPTIHGWSVPTSDDTATGITAGADGGMWFGERAPGTNGAIGRIDATGQSPAITDWPTPTNQGYMSPNLIGTGPDGNVWLTSESLNSPVGRVDPSGSGTAWPLPDSTYPYAIVEGADGAMWFTQWGSSNAIGRVTTGGAMTSSGKLGSGTMNLSGIALGPDGNVWFTENGAGAIGKIAPDMTVTQFVLATGSQPVGITAGPDGALWFTDAGKNAIGRIPTTATPADTQVTEYTGLTGSSPSQITTGPDSALWFTECNSSGSGPASGYDVIGRIDAYSHTISEYSTGSISAKPYGIASGPDGAIWFTLYGISQGSVYRVAFQTSSALRRRPLSAPLEARLKRFALRQ